LYIDPHKELRHLDSVDWSDLFSNSVELKLGGESIRVLRAEDHLRVLCVHWLTDGARNKERLWDIYYILDNRDENFSWDRFLGIVDARRRRWLVCAVGLANRYLGLDISDTPIAAEANELPRWVINTVEWEWSSEVAHWPLESYIADPKMMLRQIRRRLRPNPIWATVQMQGSFDSRTRIFYHIGALSFA